MWFSRKRLASEDMDDLVDRLSDQLKHGLHKGVVETLREEAQSDLQVVLQALRNEARADIETLLAEARTALDKATETPVDFNRQVLQAIHSAETAVKYAERVGDKCSEANITAIVQRVAAGMEDRLGALVRPVRDEIPKLEESFAANLAAAIKTTRTTCAELGEFLTARIDLLAGSVSKLSGRTVLDWEFGQAMKQIEELRYDVDLLAAWGKVKFGLTKELTGYTVTEREQLRAAFNEAMSHQREIELNIKGEPSKRALLPIKEKGE